MIIKHPFQSAMGDGGNSALVQPSNWNANHDIEVRGAMVNLSSAQSIPNATPTEVEWDSEVYDTDDIHDNVVNPERLTVPAGVTKVRLYAYQEWVSDDTGDRMIYLINQATSHLVIDSRPPAEGNGNGILASPPLSVVAGNYFYICAWQNSGGALDFSSTNRAYFAMEIIG
jgi:hypothetical protein